MEAYENVQKVEKRPNSSQKDSFQYYSVQRFLKKPGNTIEFQNVSKHLI